MFVACKGRRRKKGVYWRLGRAVDVIFNMADLQDSRRYQGYRILLTLLGYGVLLILLIVDFAWWM